MTFTIPPPPSPPHVFIFQANLSGPLSESFQSFQRSPPFGFLVTNDPQGINNDRSLICFAVIMQHASMAYHVQRAYKGPGIWLLRGGGWWKRWFQKKSILKSDFEHKKVLQGNTYHTIALYVREKHSMITRGLAENNTYANPWSHPN